MNTAIDASAGLTLVNETPISASGTVQVNNCFTTVYDNYFIDLTLSNIASSTTVTFQLSSSGTPNSSSVYQYQSIGTYSNIINAATVLNTTNWAIASPNPSTLNDVFIYQMHLNRPALADKTLGFGRVSYIDTSVPARWTQTVEQLRHDNDTAYDGLRITMGANSGILRIYGYKN
jgi:hypothetical protein